VLAVLEGVADPTPAELKIVLDASAANADVEKRVWLMFRSPNWFARLDADGQLQRWLNTGTVEQQHRSIDILGMAAGSNPDRVAAILAAYRYRPEYHDYLRWATRFAELHTSRPLFELLLDAVRNGAAAGRESELWLPILTLADHQSAWAIELIAAYFIDWPGGLDLTVNGRVERLSLRDYTLAELVRKAAAAEPARFVDSLLPYMTDVMKVAATGTKPLGFPTDPHFSYYDDEMVASHDADDAMHVGMRSAIEQLVRADPAAAKPMLQGLADIRLSAAQSLLYLGLIAGGGHHANWSADLLLDGVDRLFCGTRSNSVWVARQLIETIAPHISEEKHLALEEAVRDLRFDWERRQVGYYAFTLLSALQPSRLTALGKRRLGEYQRKF
jgi:hypothetical protein